MCYGPLGKSQMADKSFHRYAGTYPFEKQMDQLGPNASPGRSLPPYMKHVDDSEIKHSQDPSV